MSWYHSLSQSESLPARNIELIDGSPRQDRTPADKKSWGMLLRSSVQVNSQTVDLETKRSLLNYRHNTDLQFEVRSLCIFSIYFLSFNSLKKCQKVCLKQVKVKCVSSYLILRILYLELFWEANSNNCCLFRVWSFVFLRVTPSKSESGCSLLFSFSPSRLFPLEIIDHIHNNITAPLYSCLTIVSHSY